MNQAEQEESEEEGEMQDEDPRVREEEDRKQKAHAELITQYPKWPHPLEPGSKSMPTEGLLNVDPDEGSVRIFDSTSTSSETSASTTSIESPMPLNATSTTL